MSHVPTDLGSRILSATRLAVMTHWQQTLVEGQSLLAGETFVARQVDGGGSTATVGNELHGQPGKVGGADSLRVTEDQLSLAHDGGAEVSPRRPSCNTDPAETAYEITVDAIADAAAAETADLLEQALFLSDLSAITEPHPDTATPARRAA